MHIISHRLVRSIATTIISLATALTLIGCTENAIDTDAGIVGGCMTGDSRPCSTDYIHCGTESCEDGAWTGCEAEKLNLDLDGAMLSYYNQSYVDPHLDVPIDYSVATSETSENALERLLMRRLEEEWVQGNLERRIHQEVATYGDRYWEYTVAGTTETYLVLRDERRLEDPWNTAYVGFFARPDYSSFTPTRYIIDSRTNPVDASMPDLHRVGFNMELDRDAACVIKNSMLENIRTQALPLNKPERNDEVGMFMVGIEPSTLDYPLVVVRYGHVDDLTTMYIFYIAPTQPGSTTEFLVR